MSDCEGNMEGSDLQMLTAEYKDGQLQIVEVTPFDKNDTGESSQGDHILTEMNYEEDRNQQKYTVLDSNKGLFELDLLNLTLVRCQDGDDSIKLNTEVIESNETSNDENITYVIQSSDNETEQDNQESYVLVDNQNGEGPLVFFQSSLQQTNVPKKEEPKKKSLSYSEILERAKALQKAKVLASRPPSREAGRKRKSDLPSPHELLSSPNFKLYLYTCKWCGFKCNAVKEMSAHKAAEHRPGNRPGTKPRGCPGRSQAITLQCARCPFRGYSHMQLSKHVEDTHPEVNKKSYGKCAKNHPEVNEKSYDECAEENHPEVNEKTYEPIQLNTDEVKAADVLVCGACGFESGSRSLFRRHIEDVHGAATC